jgi:hypothetical protein
MSGIDTDYLVIGAGLMGLSFADTLLAELPDATITIVDRHARPGGHWNDAYPFVTLHQPSSYYGVASMTLGSGQIDSHGLNAGLQELASGSEVLAYFEAVMNHRLLPSGRVRYFPMSDYADDGRIVSLISGAETPVRIARKTVDTTYLGTSVPSTHHRKFAVADGVRIMPPNGLPHLWQDPANMPSHFTVLGAGKTGMDTVIWLLKAGAAPDMISWVMPRASWFYNRGVVQNAPAFFEASIGGFLRLLHAEAAASDANDLFLRLEAIGYMHRISRDVVPTMFHYAVASEAEVAMLRRVTDVIRLGRVVAIDPAKMVLEHGQRATAPGTVFIDCTASAVERRPQVPVFQPDRIVAQMIRMPNPSLSAALIAWVEANVDGELAQNALTPGAPLPDLVEEFPRAELANLGVQACWSSNPALAKWVSECRLDGVARLIRDVSPDDTAKMAILKQLQPAVMAAATNLQKLSA